MPHIFAVAGVLLSRRRRYTMLYYREQYVVSVGSVLCGDDKVALCMVGGVVHLVCLHGGDESEI